MQLQQKQAELALTQKKIDQESQAADQEHSIRMQEMVDKASDRQQQRAMQREAFMEKMQQQRAQMVMNAQAGGNGASI